MTWTCLCTFSVLFVALLGLHPVQSGFLPASRRSGGSYLVTTPRVYRTDTVQQINVHRYKDDKQIWNITALLMTSRNKNVISNSWKMFAGDEHGSIDIKVPKNVPNVRDGGNIYVKVVGIAAGKTMFSDVVTLTLENVQNTLFIQTDKPIYKPGQTIQLRIIGVKSDLKPLVGKVKTVYITNPKRVRMMQWNDLNLKNGIASVKMPLSKYPVIGKWKIQAEYEGKKVEKSIEISKYVLPKFQVIIEPPPYIAKDSKVFTAAICAKYTYGQPVKGILKAKFVLTRIRFRHRVDWWNSRPPITDTIPQSFAIKIKGCHTFSFTNKEFKLKKVKLSRHFSRFSRANAFLTITASLTEEATGISQTAKSTKTTVVDSKITLKFLQTPKAWAFFKPGLPLYGKLLVATPDGKPLANETVRVTAEGGNRAFFSKSFVSPHTGIIDFKTKKVPINVVTLQLVANHYRGVVTTSHPILPWFSRSSSFLLLKRLEKPLKVGQQAKVNFQYTAKGNANVRNVFYNLMCKGNVALSGQTNINRTKSQKLKEGIAEESIDFTVTLEMVPACRLFVYFVRKDGEVVADSMVVDIEDKLENKVFVRFSDTERRPGQPVQITMTTSPGSTVALAAADQSIRLLQQADDLTPQQVLGALPRDVGPKPGLTGSRLCYQDFYADTTEAINDAGLVYSSDSNIESRPCQRFPSIVYLRNVGGGGGGAGDDVYKLSVPQSRRRKKYRRKDIKKPGQPKKKDTKQVTKSVRKHFPETWLWTEETISNSTGQKTITAKVPDTITSWYLSAFAMSSSTGMGVAESSTLTAFQPFFISYTLPYSVIRGEQVSLVTTVFNYMTDCATVAIRLRNTSDFQLGSSEEKKLCICGNEAKSVKFVITPLKLSHIPLEVTVKTIAPSLCGNNSKEAPLGMSDTVTRKLLVEAEGIRQEYTYSNIFCPKDDSGQVLNEKLDISLPKNVVKDSAHATVSAIGDVMGPSLTGLESSLRLPYGCGEQTMAIFAPNIFIMQYLKSTNQLTDDVEEKAVGFLRSGYQRELTFKRKDGSYSAFGDRDKEGSLWLTSFVLRSFSQARPFIFVDDEEIKFTTKWVQGKQLSNGCFKKHGKLFNKGLQGGVSTPTTLTAYIVISLLESNMSPKSNVIVKALQCIISRKNSVTDPYGNAIIAYALTLAKHPGRQDFIQRLNTQAIVKDGMMHWEEKPKASLVSPVRSFWIPPCIRARSADIEMTSYALMAIIGDGSNTSAIAQARPIVRWISKQRNALGGFSSTQDTCVALQGLSKFARFVYKPGTRLRIDVGQSNGRFQHTFRITDNNRLVLQRAVIPQQILPIKDIPVDVVGDGCALVQADVLYNVPDVQENPAFNLSVSVRRRQGSFPIQTTEAGEELCQPLDLNVCAKWLEPGESGMAIVDIKLVSGFTPDEESLETLVNHDSLDMMKFELEETKVVFYFDKIKDVCFSFVMHQTNVVKKTKPASATVYDYYDTDESATTTYRITEDLCKTDSTKQ